MGSEVFRFVNLRAPRQTGREADDLGAVVLYSGDGSRFLGELARLKIEKRPRADYEARAHTLLASDEYPLRTTPAVDFRQLDQWITQHPPLISADEVRRGVENTLNIPLDDLLDSDRYASSRLRLADAILALNITPSSPTDKALLTRWMRIAGLLEKARNAGDHVFDKQSVLRAPVILPAELFPLPSAENPHHLAMAKAAEEARNERVRYEAVVSQLGERIASRQRALSELTNALRADTNDLRKAAAISPRPVRARLAARASRDADAAAMAAPPAAAARPPAVSAPPAAAAPLPPAVLSASRAAALSAPTKSVLKDLGIADDFVDVSYATSTLEREIANTATMLFRGHGARAVTRIGDRWVPVRDGMVVDPGRGWREPGPCLPSAIDDPTSTGPTIPATTISEIRPVGIADLLQVRQTVKRYALGEIAHIENIMIGETRERTHRETTKVTETLTIETERTKEESRDLQTAERFELQQETSEVLREESSREISLSVSASYGPVSATASLSVGHSESAEESKKDAVRYSREITDKAVKKVQERVLERRSVTTEKEWEEANRHAFDNAKGAAHVQGIYRWVDKIYEAQVVSYGLRTMYELVVPEPSALYKHALSVMPPEGLRLEMPDPPGYCQHPDGVFSPLLPTDLNATNYPFWVTKYGATGVEPPPPEHKTIGICITHQPEDDNKFVALGNTELQVPAGYRAERGFVGGEGILYDTSNPDEFMTFHVGRTRLPINTSGPMNGEDGLIPVAGHGYSVAAVAVAIEILCVRTREAYEAWQLATYNAIMTAYNEQKSQYESALARMQADVQAGVSINGRNPATNREIERTELKRACLSLLTGQHFDDFDAMRRGTPPYGYPQMHLADAAAEGAYIRFFEQAFEWGNISYRFYPYFWGRKSEWPAYLRLDDTDPLFGRFLQAGAARVQVPVRPGFEEAVLYFLQTANKPWEEEDTAFVIGGSLYLSMIDEIKEEQRGAFTKGQGTIAVQQGNARVIGTGSAFEEKLHTDRDIIINERTYRVKDVVSATELFLDRPYQDMSESDVPYAFGARVVGDPWEVRVPTNLVFLQTGNELPNLANA